MITDCKVASRLTITCLPLSAAATGNPGSPILILCLSSIDKKLHCSLTRIAFGIETMLLRNGYQGGLFEIDGPEP